MSGATVAQDHVHRTFKRIERLLKAEVLVGIPESTSEREDNGRVTNAGAAYINEFGSPAANIPERPFLIPGVKHAQPKTLYQLKMAAREALAGNEAKMEARLARAGIIAAQSAKDAILYGNFVPLAPSTIRNRWRKRNGVRGQKGSMRPEEKQYLALVAAGTMPADAQAQVGIIPLINTSQMLNAITHVVRKK